MNFTLINSTENVSADFSGKELENSKTYLLYPNTETIQIKFQPISLYSSVFTNVVYTLMPLENRRYHVFCAVLAWNRRTHSSVQIFHKEYEYLSDLWALKFSSKENIFAILMNSVV